MCPKSKPSETNIADFGGSVANSLFLNVLCKPVDGTTKIPHHSLYTHLPFVRSSTIELLGKFNIASLLLLVWFMRRDNGILYEYVCDMEAKQQREIILL